MSWEEFLQGWERITSVGFPVVRTAGQAWPHFRGWRINYEAAAYKLASGLDAVPARWSGPRRHAWRPFEPRRLINRTPEHPDGQPVPRELGHGGRPDHGGAGTLPAQLRFLLTSWRRPLPAQPGNGHDSRPASVFV